MARRSKKPETAAEIGVTAGKIVNQYAGVETAWHPRQDRMLESEPIDNQDRLVLEGIAPMESTPTKTAARRPPGPVPLSPMGAVLLAVLFGLCGGYLDLGVIVFKKICLNPERSFRCARDFPWTVPVSHAVLLMIPGVVVGAVNRLRPKLVSLKAAAWLFATLAIWSALLRMPVYGACSLVMAAGLARLNSHSGRRPVACTCGRCDRSRR